MIEVLSERPVAAWDEVEGLIGAATDCDVLSDGIEPMDCEYVLCVGFGVAGVMGCENGGGVLPNVVEVGT